MIDVEIVVCKNVFAIPKIRFFIPITLSKDLDLNP